MKRWIQQIFMIVFALEGVIACLGVYNNRQQLPIPFSQFTLIYKTAALGLVCFVVTTILGLLWLIYRSILTPDRYLRILQRTKEFLKNQRNCILIIFFMLLSIFLAGQSSIQIQYIENLLQKSFLILTQPAWLWLILFCFEITILVLLLGGYGKIFLQPNVTRPVIIFLILFSLGYGLIQMGYGYKNINTVKYNFDLTGFPIMGYQVILACIFAALGLLLEEWLNKHCSTSKWASPRLKDIVVAIALFLTAFLVWKGIPLTENTFFDQKQPPNYEYYPNSDALLYDRTAQNLLAVGEFQTFLGDDNQSLARRPALVFFQAIMHRTIGLGYEEIINLQVAVFSLLPVLLYILGSSLHSRASGLLAAILIILRERNALLLGGVITGVNSKLLMSEIPTMMGIILFLILFIQWVGRPAKRTILPLLSGGVLGATMLVRQEVGVIIPFAAIGAGLYLHKKFGSYLKNMVLVVFGILLVITPWIYRNWHKTGFIFLSEPGNRLYLLTDVLRLDPDQINQEDSFLLPDDQAFVGEETPLIRSVSNVTQPSPGSAYQKNLILNRGLDKADGSDTKLDLLLNHFANQLIQTVVYLPSNPLVLDLDYLSKMVNGKLDRYYGGAIYSPKVYVKSLPYWWPDWDGWIPFQSILPVSLTLALIALGISGVWRERGWIVSIPLLALIAHILIYIWIRRSGGRFLQEVDWITGLFYSIGLVELIRLGLRWLGYLPARANQVSEGLPPLPKFIYSKLALSVIPVGLFVLGSSIPVVEYLTPNQYSSAALDQKATQLLDFKDSPFLAQERSLLIDFIDQGGQVVYARALYPRFFEPGESFYDVRSIVWGGLERDQEMRTEFYLAGTDILWGVLFREEPPVVFPHGSDVVAIGCEVGGSFDTVVVVIYSEGGDQVEAVLWRDGALEDFSGCPLVWPGE
jgi:hypothetical protein